LKKWPYNRGDLSGEGKLSTCSILLSQAI
jgi:hypothetical protein